MTSSTSFDAGDIVLVAFPFTDLSSKKQRPAVVVSPSRFNEVGEDIVLAAMTSRIPRSLPPGTVLVSRADLAEGSLPKDSVVKLTKLFTMHEALVRKRIGRLQPAKLSECLEGLREFFSEA